MRSEREEAVALFLLAALAGAAIMGVPFVTDAPEAGPADHPEPENLIEAGLEAIHSKPIAAVRTDTVERTGERERQTVLVKEDPPDRSVIELVDSTHAVTRDKTVINRSVRWDYDEDENRVITSETDGYWLSDTQTFGTNFVEVRDAYEASYAGTETVEGHDTHVVELTPPDETAAELSLDVRAGDRDYRLPLFEAEDETWYLAQETWWIDTETNYPVQQRIEWVDDDGDPVATTTRTYVDLTIGVDHEEDVFEFEPPADAEVVEPNFPDTEEFDSREAAEAAVPYDVPEPTVPDGYSLERISVGTLGDSTTVMLTYFSGRDSLNVYTTDGRMLVDEDDIVNTGLGDVDGDLYITGNTPALVWECGDLSHRVTGSLDGDELVEVADSVGC